MKLCSIICFIQEMRARNRDRLPAWVGRARRAAARMLREDPIAARLLPAGPWLWTYNWLVHGRAAPAPLWDAGTIVPKAPFLWGSGGQLCGVLNASASIALVGNGPITDAQRAEINAAGRVLRFNALNNRSAAHWFPTGGSCGLLRTGRCRVVVFLGVPSRSAG